jgi:hypothetical protein
MNTFKIALGVQNVVLKIKNLTYRQIIAELGRQKFSALNRIRLFGNCLLKLENIDLSENK